MKPGKFVLPRRSALSFAILTLCLGCAALLLAGFIPPAQASDGRDFAGFYDVTGVTDLGFQVRLTFSARVSNYSDADVSGATVTLKGVGGSSGAYATFSSISLRDRESVTLSHEITVPKSEYLRWHGGRHPLLIVEYQDQSGATQRRVVELSRGPVDGGQR